MIKAVNERIRKFFEQPVNNAIDAVAGVFAKLESLSDEDRIRLALIKAVLPSDPAGMEKALARFRSGLEKKQLSEHKIATLIDFIRQVAPVTPERALPLIKSYSPERQRETVANLLALSLEHGEYRAASFDLIAKLAEELGIGAEELNRVAGEIKAAEAGRSKIIRSGTGIILALIVIGLFVLIATWLSSLLFGLVLAYIFLPVEKYFEKRFSTPPGVVSRIWKVLFGWMSLGNIRKKLTRHEQFELSPEELERREQKALITKAVTVTVSCVVSGFLLLVIGVLLLLNSYVGTFRTNIHGMVNKVESSLVNNQSGDKALVYDQNGKLQNKPAAPEKVVAETKPESFSKVKNWARKYTWGKRLFPSQEKKAVGQAAAPVVNPVEQSTKKITNWMIRLLDNLKHRFEKLPLVQNILTELSNYLADGKAEKQLSELLMKKSGGLFAFLGKFIAGFASFLLNILMTFFFFSLLLGKLAQFQKSRSGAGEMPATGYLVRTVFNGKWLPQMSEENLRDGDRIVGEVCSKLRIWLRGYMTMIAIDFCVYTLAFTLLRVPYAPLLAAGAALGILLPYIGPISSALISVLVTLAVGGADASVMQVAGVIGIYLLHNGIVEQFFIYPAIIGESLGLTTLETIIVVLLGGIIAGIPGLIFALPVASVIKYLVPQIYRCWR